MEEKENNNFDKKSWIQKIKKERQEVYALIDKAISELKTDKDSFMSYLDTQAKFDKYSVGNALLIMKQMPNATQLKSYKDWKKNGVEVKRFEESIHILEPSKKSNEEPLYYNVKNVFDVSQTNSSSLPKKNYLLKDILTGLLTDSPINIKAVDEIPNCDNLAKWNSSDNILYVQKSEDANRIIQDISKELAYASMGEYTEDHRNFFSNISSYMICKKYDIDVSNIKIDIPEDFKEAENKDIRNDLSNVRNIVADVNNRINIYLKTLSTSKEEHQTDRGEMV